MGMMILLRVMSRSDRWYPSVPGTTAGSPGLEQEDVYHRGESGTGAGGRMDDDEDNTLGMTQKVSERFTITQSRERSSE